MNSKVLELSTESPRTFWFVTRCIRGDCPRMNPGRVKVRMDRIDAPESQQEYGKEATEYLKRRIFGKTVKVEWEKRDRRGNFVAVADLIRQQTIIFGIIILSKPNEVVLNRDGKTDSLRGTSQKCLNAGMVSVARKPKSFACKDAQEGTALQNAASSSCVSLRVLSGTSCYAPEEFSYL